MKRSKLDEESTVKDYGRGKRTPTMFRWILILCVISIPLVYLMYMLLDETVLADFQGEVVFDIIMIRTPGAGYAEALYVEEGEHVKKSQDLLQFQLPGVDSELAYLQKEKERIESRLASVSRKSTGSVENNLEHLKQNIVQSQEIYDNFLKYYAPIGHI